MNTLYYGDNLGILREHIDRETVDLVYLDPPFKSSQDYNVLFAEQDGSRSAAQILAFEDTWRWDLAAEATYREVVESGGKVSHVMQGFREYLGANDMLAYLAMMAPRLMELRRVLKPTGSIYLHCDPTASHYLKVLMDAVFGPVRFLSEIIWKRTSAHSSAKRYGPVHDSILVYTRSDTYTWNPVFQPFDEYYVSQFYTHVDPDGRRWRRSDLTGAGVRYGKTGRPWRGIDVTGKGRHWFKPPAELSELDKQGKIHWPKKAGGMPMLKRYLDEQPGVSLQDVWTDIKPMHNLAAERLGYPTQKPEALLERILKASSNEGDVVLDPFCGCGTAIAVAQRLNREWIGIDVTHLAISLIRHRLRQEAGKAVTYDVIGEPVDMAGAQALATQDPHEFQRWVLGKVGARATQVKKGADQGIDGRLYFHDEKDTAKTKQVIFSVKSGGVSVKDVRDLRGVLDREKAQIGVLVSMESVTRPMTVEAVSMGFYASPWSEQQYPRMQLLTIEELLNGRNVQMPPTSQTSVTFARPRRRKSKPEYRQQELL